MKPVVLSLLSIFTEFSIAQANVILPPIISDNMMLQQPQSAIWGKADPCEKVTVTFSNSAAQTVADQNGNWRVKLIGLKPCGASFMKVAGKNITIIKNIVVGDVWVGSGQSNMEMSVVRGPWCPYGGALDAEQEAAAANYPAIRMFIVSKTPSETVTEDVQGKWEICTPPNVPHWSAACYFFARQLYQDLKYPIGTIQSASGGSSCQSWTPSEVLWADPEFTGYVTKRQQDLKDYPQNKEKYDKELIPAWEAAVKEARDTGKPVPPKPSAPVGPAEGCSSPSILYNGMMYGVTKYSVKGVIWYQGETNVGDFRYHHLLPAMIDSWRQAWNSPALPFYIVQLANFQARQPEPTASNWAELRDVQRHVADTESDTGLAVAIDIGDEKNIHPANKQEVGRRLALLAEAKTYGKNIVCSGPAFDTATFDGSDVKITFKPKTAQGLTTRDKGPVKGFAIAGNDKKYMWADSKIVTDKNGSATITIHSPQITTPIFVRYAYDDNPEVNLVNQEGLPAVPFLTFRANNQP